MKSIIIWIAATAALQLLGQRQVRKGKHWHYTNSCPPPEILPNEIVIDGKELNIPVEEIHRILNKRFIYYAQLQPSLQEVFLKRLQKFISKKIFIIEDDEGFREMPVLVSAAAIQLTIGLKNYLLSFYRYICIFPEEFFREGSFNILVGNVQDNIITVAWNHFLKGFGDPTNGSNVGLHEMSHALYIQKLVIDEGYAKEFSECYERLVDDCEKAAQMEKAGLKDLYSPYADTDLQEFWAESVELFFEKPAELLRHYPEVYESMKLLLNQEPIDKSNPLLESNLSLHEKADQIKTMLMSRLGINLKPTIIE